MWVILTIVQSVDPIWSLYFFMELCSRCVLLDVVSTDKVFLYNSYALFGMAVSFSLQRLSSNIGSNPFAGFEGFSNLFQ